YVDQAAKGKIAPFGVHFESRADSAAVVKSVDADSSAAKADMHSGDQVISIVVGVPGAKLPLQFVSQESTPTSARVMTVGLAETALSSDYKSGSEMTVHVVDSSGKQVSRKWTIDSQTLTPARSLPVHPTQLYSAVDALLI